MNGWVKDKPWMDDGWMDSCGEWGVNEHRMCVCAHMCVCVCVVPKGC